MEKVWFNYQKDFKLDFEENFIFHKTMLQKILPHADIQHIGSTAVPNSLTKGDLDIQIRVTQSQFEYAVQQLSKLYEVNEGSSRTDNFRAFKDDTITPPLGIQLTVINSELDFFWKFRDVLSKEPKYKDDYNNLKKEFQGKSMEDYRKEKNVFINQIMATDEFKALE